MITLEQLAQLAHQKDAETATQSAVLSGNPMMMQPAQPAQQKGSISLSGLLDMFGLSAGKDGTTQGDSRPNEAIPQTLPQDSALSSSNFMDQLGKTVGSLGMLANMINGKQPTQNDSWQNWLYNKF